MTEQINGNKPRGLFRIGPAGVEPSDPNSPWIITDRLGGRGQHPPGSVLIGTAGWSLLALAGGLLFVSFAGQYAYLLAARHQAAPSMVAALMFDAGMIIFSLLALGLARAGQPARTDRALILACAAGSAVMNYAAADVTSPRSVAAYVAPPLFLAVVVDRVIAVVRRHILGDDAGSPWTPVGHAVAWSARTAVMLLLYTLRFMLARRETWQGIRQAVLNATPLPAVSDAGPVSKKARLLALYRAHEGYGDKTRAAAIAGELAPLAELQPGTARTYIGDELRGIAP